MSVDFFMLKKKGIVQQYDLQKILNQDALVVKTPVLLNTHLTEKQAVKSLKKVEFNKLDEAFIQ